MSQVWRVEWNVTGTILASSGDDGCVRLWKGKIENEEKNAQGIIVCVNTTCFIHGPIIKTK